MSLQRTPPKTPSTPIEHTLSESDLNLISEVSYVNTSRNTRCRSNKTQMQSPRTYEVDLKDEITKMFKNFKTELDAKLNDICDKQNLLITKLSTDICELKIQTTKIQTSNDEIVQSMSFINNQYEELKMGLENLHKERAEQRKCIENIEKKVQDLQLKSRSSCIEIRNITPSEKETSSDLINTVCTIGKVVGTTVTPTDFRDIYRIPGKPGLTRPIVAEFQSVQMKHKTLSAVRDFNNSRKAVVDKLNTELIGIPGKKQAVYIADHLPASLKKLFFQSREFAKQHGYQFCWTSNGNIFIRKAHGEKQIIISSEQSLMDLKPKQ